MTSELNFNDAVYSAEQPVAPRLLPNIAFMGKAGSGKTSAAEVLIRGYGYRQISFAAELKRIAMRLWGADALTNRGLMQDLGRKMRDIDPMVWVTVALRNVSDKGLMDATGSGPWPVVIDDLRFPNEYHELRKLGFVIVRVEAHRNDRINRLRAINKLQDEEQLNDISETALDDAVADYTLINTRDLDELQDSVVKIIEREARRRA